MVTGIGMPFSWSCFFALKDLQNSMMLRPRWPSAGPIGGDGLADPAGTCSFRYPVTFFAMRSLLSLAARGRVQGSWCGSRRLAAAITCHGSENRRQKTDDRSREVLH